MARSIDADLATLRQCRDNADDPQNEEKLRTALRNRSCRVVERAAQIAAEQQRQELLEDLLHAHERFMVEAVKSDPGCVAKTACCDALRQLDHHDHDFYLRGIRYVQIEPGYGGGTDAAAQLRAICGFALVEFNYVHCVRELTDLLADPDKTARAGAARALAWARRPESEPLLRLKVHVGDGEPEVLGECFAGLLQLAPDASVPLILRQLDSGLPEVRYEAAISLGESRRPEALEPLRQLAFPSRDRDQQRALLLAIALLQTDQAIQFLLSLVSADDPAAAVSAIGALRHAGDRAKIREKLAKRIADCREPRIDRAFREDFGSDR